MLQEAHIGSRIPFYLDSATTVFVACSDSAVKRSAWLIRRVAVLEEGVSHGIIQPLHINEYDMVADPYTKYLAVHVYARLTHYVNNFRGPLPARNSGNA